MILSQPLESLRRVNHTKCYLSGHFGASLRLALIGSPMLMSCTVSFEAWNSCHRHRARSVSPEIGPPWTPGLPQFTGLDVPFESQTSLSCPQAVPVSIISMTAQRSNTCSTIQHHPNTHTLPTLPLDPSRSLAKKDIGFPPLQQTAVSRGTSNPPHSFRKVKLVNEVFPTHGPELGTQMDALHVSSLHDMKVKERN